MALSPEQQASLALGVILMNGWDDEDPERVRAHIAEHYGRKLPLAVVRAAQLQAQREKAEALFN